MPTTAAHSKQLLLVCGAPRSGTTILWDLCNRHPKIRLTQEFRNFDRLGEPYPQYAEALSGFLQSRAWYLNRIEGVDGKRGILHRVARTATSHLLIKRYFRKLRARCPDTVQPSDIGEVLRELMPDAEIVGDKYPGYFRTLDSLAAQPELALVVIYRDARDVVSSWLKVARNPRHPWRNATGDVRKIADTWVQAIEAMERNRGRVHMIRYEDLMGQPKEILSGLGEHLGVDGDGFPAHLIRPTSVGKHKKGLTPEELAVVEEVAGPTLARLRYV